MSLIKFGGAEKNEIRKKVVEALVESLFPTLLAAATNAVNIEAIADKITDKLGEKVGNKESILGTIVQKLNQEKDILANNLSDKINLLKNKKGMVRGNTNEENVNDSEQTKKSKKLIEFNKRQAAKERAESKLEEANNYLRSMYYYDKNDNTKKIFTTPDGEAIYNSFNEKVITKANTDLSNAKEVSDYDKITDFLEDEIKDLRKKLEKDKSKLLEEKSKKAKDKLDKGFETAKKDCEKNKKAIIKELSGKFDSAWSELESLFSSMKDIPKLIMQIPLSVIVSTPTGPGVSINKIPEAILNLKILADNLGVLVAKVKVALEDLGIDGTLEQTATSANLPSNIISSARYTDKFYRYISNIINEASKVIVSAGGYISIAEQAVIPLSIPEITIDIPNSVDPDDCSNYVHDSTKDEKGEIFQNEEGEFVYVNYPNVKLERDASNCSGFKCPYAIREEPKEPTLNSVMSSFSKPEGMTNEEYLEICNEILESDRESYESDHKEWVKEKQKLEEKLKNAKCKDCTNFKKRK